MTETISINTQSSIRITGKSGAPVFYFDPLNIREEKRDADVIFITHDHYDHFSPADIAKIAKADTKLVAPEGMRSKVMKESGLLKEQILLVHPNENLELPGGYPVVTVPAYNKLKPFHPKRSGWCGYVVTLEDTRYYIAGDMDDTPDARNVTCDVALVPIGGTYTMDAGEAAAFINAIRPKTVIPTHYGSIVGSPGDGERFKSLVADGILVEFRL